MPSLARSYAGVLGTLAMTVVVLRGIKEASSLSSVLWTAMGLMAVFSAVGLVIGWLAETTIVGSVRAQFDEEVKKETRRAAEQASQAPSPGAAIG